MTPLKQWKKENGLNYDVICRRLGGRWGRVHIVNVFNGKSAPGILLFSALLEYTGLSADEILSGLNIPAKN